MEHLLIQAVTIKGTPQYAWDVVMALINLPITLIVMYGLIRYVKWVWNR